MVRDLKTKKGSARACGDIGASTNVAVIKYQVLTEAELEAYAVMSPTARTCLAAYNACVAGFQLGISSNFKDPKALEYLAHGSLLHHKIFKDVRFEYKDHVESILQFLNLRMKDYDPYAVYLYFVDLPNPDGLSDGVDLLSEVPIEDDELRAKMIGVLNFRMGEYYLPRKDHTLGFYYLEQALAAGVEPLACLLGMATLHTDTAFTEGVKQKVRGKKHFLKALHLVNKVLEIAVPCDQYYSEALYQKAFLYQFLDRQGWVTTYEDALASEKQRLPFLPMMYIQCKEILKGFYVARKPVKCSSCGRQAGTGIKLLQCPCYTVHYCGKRCQMKERENHVKLCPLEIPGYVKCSSCDDWILKQAVQTIHCRCDKVQYCSGKCEQDYKELHEEEECSVSGDSCSACHKSGEYGVSLLRCACRAVMYCDNKCQREHWSTHKLTHHNNK